MSGDDGIPRTKVLGSDLMKSFRGQGKRTQSDIGIGDVGTVEDLFVKAIADDLCVKLLDEREGFRITEKREKDFGRVRIIFCEGT